MPALPFSKVQYFIYNYALKNHIFFYHELGLLLGI